MRTNSTLSISRTFKTVKDSNLWIHIKRIARERIYEICWVGYVAYYWQEAHAAYYWVITAWTKTTIRRSPRSWCTLGDGDEILKWRQVVQDGRNRCAVPSWHPELPTGISNDSDDRKTIKQHKSVGFNGSEFACAETNGRIKLYKYPWLIRIKKNILE